MDNEVVNRPGLFKLYKGLGAATFGLLPPKHNEKGFLDKQGGVLIEAAPSKGKMEWDWDKKITFAISVADICNLIDMDVSKRRIFHEHQNTPKSLEFKEGTDNFAGTYMLSLAEGKGAARKVINVPLSNGEYQVLIRLLVQTVPMLLGWTANAMEAQAQKRFG